MDAGHRPDGFGCGVGSVIAVVTTEHMDVGFDGARNRRRHHGMAGDWTSASSDSPHSRATDGFNDDWAVSLGTASDVCGFAVVHAGTVAV